MLTRIIHEASTAAADPGMSTALRSVGFLDDATHRLRRGALHLPAPGAPQARRCSRQNVNILLREP